MRWCRYRDGRRGLVVDGFVHDVTSLVEPHLRTDEPGDPFVRALDAVTEVVRGADLGRPACSESEARFLSPVLRPSKVIGAPVNYEDHHAEAAADVGINHGANVARIEKAGLFLKATTCLVGPSEGIELRFADRRTDHEMEVGVVIARRCTGTSLDDAMSYVAGYALALDVTLRGTEDRSFRKSIDTYGVLGPYLVSADEITDPSKIDFSLTIGGDVRQQGCTADLVKSIPELIAWAAEWYTLEPGDVIMTGTPAGVGPLDPGDVLTCEMSGDVRMSVSVRRSSTDSQDV